MKKLSPSNSNSHRFTLELFPFLFLFGFLGVILSVTAILLIESGVFVRWQMITRLPPNTSELVDGEHGIAYIRTADGKILSCEVDSPEYCWVSDIHDDSPISLVCNKQSIAFSIFANAPKAIKFCIHIVKSYVEIGYDLYYLVDPTGNLWKWELASNDSDILKYFLLNLSGGWVGVLVGSLVWISRWISLRRLKPPDFPMLTKLQMILLIMPWFCLILTVILLSALFYQPSTITQPAMTNLYTAVAATVSSQMMRTTQVWAGATTPVPSPTEYNLAKEICDSEWSVWENVNPCSNEISSSGTSVRLISGAVMEGMYWEGDAIKVDLAPDDRSLHGIFPPIEIREGDHFKTQLGCSGGDIDCSLVFEIFYETKDGLRIRLGRWAQKMDGNIEDIDLDLSKAANQTVRISFYFSRGGIVHTRQQGILLNPRIEK